MPGRIYVRSPPDLTPRAGLRGRIGGYGVLIFLAFFALSGMLLTAGPGQAQNPIGAGRRFALLIANSRYPDAQGSLPTIVKDGRLLAEELRRSDFDVDLRENLRREDVQATLDAFYAKLNAGAAAFVYFGGYGIQVERQSYLIPVNAQIWSETEVRRDGISLDAILSELNRRGVRVKIAVVDAARQNPFERRFRASSAGLAPVDAPEGSLILFSAPPGKLVREEDGDISLFVSELGKELRAPNLTAEEAFTHTRIGVSRASKGDRVPWISSSLIDEFRFAVAAANAGRRLCRTASAGPSRLGSRVVRRPIRSRCLRHPLRHPLHRPRRSSRRPRRPHRFRARRPLRPRRGLRRRCRRAFRRRDRTCETVTPAPNSSSCGRGLSTWAPARSRSTGPSTG